MKRIIIYLSAALSLLAVSCTRIEPDPQEPGNGTGLAIDLGVLSADIVRTKAATEKPGVSNLNENKVYTLDYFLFKVNPSTNTSAEAFLAGRLEFGTNGIEPTTDELAEENAQVIDLDAYYNLDDENKNCYAYVIANLPDSFTWTDGKLYSGTTAVGSGTDGAIKWTDLQAIEVVASFKESLDGGKFKPQKSFVMTGLNNKTLTGKGADLLIVDLSRVAAKITLDLNVVKLYDKYEYNTTSGDYAYKGSYFPNIDKIQVYLTYVDESGVLSGTADEYDNTFITYTRNAYIPTVDDSTFKNRVLARDDEGNIIIDSSGNPTYVESASFPSFDVQGTPFYTYPIKWNVTDTHAPFIKIIIPWVKYDVPAGLREQYTIFNQVNHTVDLNPTSAAYLALVDAVVGDAEDERTFDQNMSVSVSGTSYSLTRTTTAAAMTSRFGDEYYYKINIPVEDYELASNNWYMIKLDISVLGSESDDAMVVIDGSTMGIYVLDWSTPHESMGGNLDNGRYLSTAQDEYTFDAVKSIDIPVISSHTIKARITDRKVKVKGQWVSSYNTGSTPHSVADRGSVSTSGTSLLTLTNELNTTMGSNLDCYPFKFEIEITQINSDGTDTNSLLKNITVIQYPSIFVDHISGGSAMVDGYYGNVSNHYKTGFVLGTNTSGTNQGGMGGGTPFTSNTFTYREGTNSGITVQFDNSTTTTIGNNSAAQGGNICMRVGTRTSNGTITFTAPQGGPNITAVYIRYSTGDNYLPTDYSWTLPEDGSTTASSYNVWRGSARKVVLSMRRNQNNSYATVQRVAVYSNSSISGYGNSEQNDRSVSTPYAPITRYATGELNMTVVTISSLGANSQYSRPADGGSGAATPQDYLIADPREVSGWSSRDLVQEILVGNRSVPNFIAPKVLVSSRWGRTVDWGGDCRSADTYDVDYETAVKRCATYQEAGYPAGRWRLPTEAEIIFMMGLQKANLISTLFSTSSAYNVTASGSILSIDGSGNISYWSKHHQLNSMRCVYDLWYWGDEPVTGAANTYTIKPTK